MAFLTFFESSQSIKIVKGLFILIIDSRTDVVSLLIFIVGWVILINNSMTKTF